MTSDSVDVAIPRWTYVLALRDILPFDAKGHQVHFHSIEECVHPCVTLEACGGTWVKFEQVSVVDDEFHGALKGIVALSDELFGLDSRSVKGVPTGPPGFRSLVVVSTPASRSGEGIEEGTAFLTAIESVQRVVNALRLATNGNFPRFSLARVWPAHARAFSTEDSTSVEIVLASDANPYPTPTVATVQQLTQSEAFLVAASRSDPVEVVRDFALSAKVALRSGDYAETVLNSAASAEVLIKHTAGMISWEAHTFPSGARPGWLQDEIVGILAWKPSLLIGKILSQALKGNWSSSSPSTPIGGWREHIARARNRVIHRGHRPTRDEAEQAVGALDRLTRFVSDRLADRVGQFPRSALCLVGPGLVARDAYERAQKAIEVRVEEEDWRTSYREWIEAFEKTDDLDD